MEGTMLNWLSKQADVSADKIALELENGVTYTFLELKNESSWLAGKLASLGVGKGTHVAILSPNNTEVVFVIHALAYLGAVAVMLNPRLTKLELEAQIVMSDTTLLLTTPNLMQEKALHFPYQKTFTELTLLSDKTVELLTEISLDTPFSMMFTSGTTGVPKAVLHTYGNHLWSAIGSMLNLGLEAQDKWLLTLPIFHIGGFSILMRSVIYGMPVYFLEKYDKEKVYNALMKSNVTIASLVTVMLRDLIEKLENRKLPKTCRTILLGGGSVPNDLLEQVTDKEIPLFQSYGMTETSSQIVTLSKEYALSKLGSAGKALFPGQLKIAEQDEYGVGEIFVKGPMVMGGYYKNRLANQESYLDEWLKTGDIGYLDSDGFLYVVDRRSDLIISGGENIYPSEIENVIGQLVEVSEVAVVAKSDDKWGQVPVAFIVKKENGLNKEKVNDFLKGKLANFKIPNEIYFVESLPRNASNKILRRELAGKVIN